MKKHELAELPDALDMSAGELVEKLIVVGGESYSGITLSTGIDRSALSRFRSGQRQANESDYRKLAKHAISQNICR